VTPGVREGIAARLLTSFGLNWRPAWDRELPAAIRALAARRSVSADRLGEALAQGQAPLLELAPFLTVGETHFLRIPEQFEAIARHAAGVLDEPGARYAAWSAGCSSGEEPLSVVLTLHQALGPLALGRLDLLATDLSAEALDKARAGVYTPWSFRGVPDAVREAYFTPTEDGRLRASPELVRAVHYRQSELVAQALSLPRASLDLILFRNVGIYLSAEHLQRLFREFARTLKPGGLLLVAPSDPRPPEPLFAPARDDGCAIYERRRGSRSSRAARGRRPPARLSGTEAPTVHTPKRGPLRPHRRAPWLAAAAATEAPLARLVDGTTHGGTTQAPTRHLLWDSALDPACGRRRTAPLGARRDAATPPRPAACLLAQTRPPAPRSSEQVADRGQEPRPHDRGRRESVEAAPAPAPSLGRPSELTALGEAESALNAGDAEGAVTALRRLLYRDPGDVAARLVLSAALEAVGQLGPARHQRRVALQTLAALGDDERASADGISAGELRRALTAQAGEFA